MWERKKNSHVGSALGHHHLIRLSVSFVPGESPCSHSMYMLEERGEKTR